MSKSNAFEVDLLEHVLNNVAIPLVGDAAGLPASAANGSLYVGLATADVGEAGTQSTNEATYTGYARIAVARNPSSKQWTVAGAASNAATIQFAACTAGSNTISHFHVGTSPTGAGKVIYKGTLNTPLAVSVGIAAFFAPGALSITED